MSKRIKELLGSDPDGSLVKAEGWVKTRRDGKNVTFLEISDGSCLKGLQIVVDREKTDDKELEGVTTGASVTA